MRTVIIFFTITTLAIACRAASASEALVIRVPDSGFVVTVPDLPQTQFQPHPAAEKNPSAKILGVTADGISVSALIPKAEGATDQMCASWLVGSTISRYVPDLSTVHIFPAGNNAWVLLYAYKVDSLEQLKAHIFSGDNNGQCIEIHMSRMGANEQQRKDWFAGFRAVNVVVK